MSDIHDRIDLKLRRMYEALGAVHSKDSNGMQLTAVQDGSSWKAGFDFTKNRNEAEEANAMWSFIASIASLKDHLKAWCNHHNVAFGGDTLINSIRDVAIIHDLWNRDKHAGLNKSRSGLWPDLRHIGRGLILRPEPGEKSVSVSLMLNPIGLAFSGQSFAGIDGKVVDQNGAGLGSALVIAENAVEAWECELRRAGVPLPSR